jgi:hypothetical protein
MLYFTIINKEYIPNPSPLNVAAPHNVRQLLHGEDEKPLVKNLRQS